LIAVLILALGIGANVAVFSVARAILLRPIPFPAPDRLPGWHPGGPTLGSGNATGLSAGTYTEGAYEEFRRHNRSFRDMTSCNPVFGNSEYTLPRRDEPQYASGVTVAYNFFQRLGVQPPLGRFFLSEECLHFRGSVRIGIPKPLLTERGTSPCTIFGGAGKIVDAGDVPI
jgi:hypothetical protein